MTEPAGQTPEDLTEVSHQFSRLAVLLWQPSEETGPSLSTFGQTRAKRICEQLNADPRVIQLREPKINPHYIETYTAYPETNSSTSKELLTGSDAFKVLDISTPILFKVRVPEKNQPKHHGANDVPSDTYWAAWDGSVLIILWEQQTDLVPLSGGHVVADILEDAASAIGDSLYNQACSPHCQNIFLHSTMHISYDLEEAMEDDISITRDGHKRALETILPGFLEDDNFGAIDWLHSNLNGIGQHFGLTKNYARRLMDIEAAVQSEVAHLLDHYYTHARLSSMPIRSSLKLRWKNRKWRRHSKYVLAGIWLSLANIEAMKRGWRDAYVNYLGYGDEAGKEALFSGDARDDVEMVSTLDTKYAESAIQQVSATFDNRNAALAAGGGAIAGGVAGAIATLATLLSQ